MNFPLSSKLRPESNNLKVLIFIFCSFFLSCSRHKSIDPEVLKQEIITVDKNMSDLATKEGFNNTLLLYADNNFVKLGEGSLPIIGKTAFSASFNKDKDVRTISWGPVNAEVAKSGELGYTWGNWKYIASDTTYFGNYFTVWKKQADGNWKMALDGGNNTPKPVD